MKRVLTVVLIAFGIANIARLIVSGQTTQATQSGTALPPLYLAVMSGIWAVVFAWAAYATARAHPLAARDTIAAIVLYQANLWLNRLAFTRSPEVPARTGFAALLSTVSIVVITALALIVHRRLSTARRQASSAGKEP